SIVFRTDPEVSILVKHEKEGETVALTMVKQRDWAKWEQRKIVKVEQVGDVATGSKVVVRPDSPFTAAGANSTEGGPPSDEPKRTRKPNAPDRNDDVALKVIDDELAEILRENPMRKWTQKDMAVALEGSPKIEVEAGTLQNTQIPLLRSK